jgi:acetyl-CoA C-acetyltransferase
MKTAFIYDAVRTPRGRGKKNGALYEVKPIELLTTVINALNERNQLENAAIDDIILGCTTPIAEQGSNIARTLALYTDWCKEAPGMQINRFCASGLEAINLAAMKIASGWEHLIIAGGVESMSRVPMGTDRGPLQYDPMVSSAIGYVPQGISADLIATKSKFSRESLDELAMLSQERANNAIQNGYFKKSIISVKDRNGMCILGVDELPRPNTTTETLATLLPVFEQLGSTGYDDIVKLQYPAIERIKHLHTGGNVAGLADGAALTLIGSAEMGKKYGLVPRAKITMAACASVNATIALEGTIPSTEKALRLAKMTLKDIDLWETNEAFAAPVLQFQRHFNIPMDKINVNGGAIAYGHPLGATGAMLVGTILDELERRDLKTGGISVCMGGGMGVTTIIERV